MSAETISLESFTFGTMGRKQVLEIQQEKDGRVVLRINGRLVAKPMLPGDSEREIVVDGRLYRVSRMEGDSWHIEPLAEIHIDGQNVDPAERSTVLFKRIMLGAIAAVMLVLVGWGFSFYRRLAVEWIPFVSPDASYKAAFPAEPATTTDTIEVDGKVFPLTIRSASIDDYVVEIWSIDLDRTPRATEEKRMLDVTTQAMIGRLGGEVVESQYGDLEQNFARGFALRRPDDPDHSTIRVKAAVWKNHVVAAVAFSDDDASAGLPMELGTFFGRFVMAYPPPRL